MNACGLLHCMCAQWSASKALAVSAERYSVFMLTCCCGVPVQELQLSGQAVGGERAEGHDGGAGAAHARLLPRH